jgi:hypothetical protein
MYRPSRNYYQIYRVDHKRNQEQMVAESKGYTKRKSWLKSTCEI